MTLPKFLLADNSAHPDSVFVIRTDYPRFIMNMATDELEWLEVFDAADERELKAEMQQLIREAVDFYDDELKNYTDA